MADDMPQPIGRAQGGMKSAEGRAAYWRMNYESAIGALADLIAEHTETVEALDQQIAETVCEVLSEHIWTPRKKGPAECWSANDDRECGQKFTTGGDYRRHVASLIADALIRPVEAGDSQ